jgi:hypothetical protein
MSSTVPNQEERDNAEEAVIAADGAITAAEPELYDEETTRTMVRSIISDSESLKAIVHTLFSNPDFKKLLAVSFINIYDTFVKMTNNALKDFESVFEVTLQQGSTGNPHEFSVIYHGADKLEFFTVDELGNRLAYQEQHPGVKASTLKALTNLKAEPNSDVIYTALIVERKVDVNFESSDGSILTAEALQAAINTAQSASLEA